jgi:hypothetical protein
MIVTPEAELRGVTSEDVLDRILTRLPVPGASG